jgi:hypothetical protein
LAEDVLATLVDGMIPGKSFAEMRMQLNFIAAGSTSSKAYWSLDCFGAFCHEGESFTFTATMILRCLGRGLVIAWLKQDKTETSCQEVSMQNN